MDKKNQEFDVLIFFQDNLMGELYSILINYMTGFECITVSSVGNAEKILKDSTKIKLVIIDFLGFKDSCIKLVFECIRKKFLIFTNDFIPRISKDPQLYKEFGGLEKYSGESEKYINNFQKAIEQYFEKELNANKNEYLAIPILLLLHFRNLGGHLFIKLVSGRYLKMFRKEDTITEEDIHKLNKRQVKYLFLERENAQDIIKIILKNEDAVTKAIQNKQILNFVTPDQMKKKLERIQKIMPLNNEELKKVEGNIEDVLKTIEQIPKFSKFIKFFKIDKNQADYYPSHIELTGRIACGIAKELGVGNPQTYKKFIFSAYLHDLTLVKNTKLAEINTKSKFDKMKNTLSKDEKKLILNHHKDSADASIKFQGVPLDVDTIIKQHHNIEDGVTLGGSAGEASLFSSIFIISHDLSDYIFFNKKWTIKDFILEKKDVYKSGNLLRVYEAVAKQDDE